MRSLLSVQWCGVGYFDSTKKPNWIVSNVDVFTYKKYSFCMFQETLERAFMPCCPTIRFLSQHQDEKSYILELNEDICCTHHRLKISALSLMKSICSFRWSCCRHVIARIPGATISERNPPFDKCLRIPHPLVCTLARRDLAIFNKCSTNNWRITHKTFLIYHWDLSL